MAEAAAKHGFSEARLKSFCCRCDLRVDVRQTPNARNHKV